MSPSGEPITITLADLVPNTTYRFNISAIEPTGGSPFVDFPAITIAGPSVTSQSSSFIRAAYQDFLNRAPRSDELRNLVAALDSGATSRSAIVQTLASSDEWVSRIVKDNYVRTLKRDGDPAGVAYWTRQLTTKRMSVVATLGW